MDKNNNEIAEAELIGTCLEKISQRAAAGDLPNLAPVEEFRLLGAAGLLKIVLPGEALDFEQNHTAALLELLKLVGKSNLSVGRIYEGHVNALYLIHLFAEDHQKKYWYNEVRSKNAVFGVWNTQASKGVTFDLKEGEFVVNGEKTFCSGAALVTHGLITGNIATEQRSGWQMLIVNMALIREERIDKSSWKTLGMRASGSFTVDFSGYRVEDRELLGNPGDYLKQPYFNGGAVRFAAVQLGGIEAIAEATIAYLSSLNRTSDPIQKTRIAQIMIGVTSGDLWISQAGEKFDRWVSQPERSADLIAFANMTRTAIEEIGVLVMKESNQCVGARGLMHPYPFERLYRDLSFYLRQPAPDATKIDIATHFFKKYHEREEV